jgi:hemerythrin-like domain-containing protein
MHEVLSTTDKLGAELQTMLDEHQAIREALAVLIAAATEEKKPEIAEFARRLIHHTMTEEQVMYPAALLVGEYLRLRLGSPDAEPEHDHGDPQHPR